MSTEQLRWAFSDIVYLEVGAKKERFGIHRGLLTRDLEFFRAALDGSFSEASTGVVSLPEDSPQIVEWLVIWLYTQKFESQDGHDLGPTH